MRNFYTMPVQKGYVQDLFQIFIAVIPDISIGSRRFEQTISLFPYPDGMCLDTAQSFQVFYRIFCHRFIVVSRELSVMSGKENIIDDLFDY